MALQMDLAISWLLVMSYSSSFVLSHHRCIPEDAYSISCATRPPAFTDAELCTSSLTYEVVDRNAGTVAFSLLFPFNESNVSTELIILSLRSSDGTECSTDVEGVHSKFTLAVDGSGFKQQNKNGSNNVNCHHNEVKKLEWKSSYLFTGCYRIDLNLNYECKSKPFRVESGFIKEVFANRSLQLFAYSSGQNVFAIYNFGIKFCHNYPQTTIVYLRSNSTYPRKRLACCFTGESVSHCHWFREEHGELVDCSCSWTEESLSCTFMEVPPGNYSIELDIIDTRCNRGTIWTGGWEKNDEEPCLWKHEPIEVKNNTLGDFPFVSPAVSFTSPWLMSIVALTAAGIGLSVYCRWRWRRRLPLLPRSSQNAADTIDIHEKLLDPPKVLLLYARDSPCFMSAMAAFRQLLRDNISAQVYDLWEDRFQDQIDAQGEVWASKFLYSENVRIVVFATPVSRRIEEALMNGLEINYRLSDHRDETFLFTFKTAMSLVPRIKEPCNKFLVVRLHRNNCSEDILQNFSTNSTVYTLPTHLQKLIFHLLQSQSVGVALNLKNAELLNDRIVVYGKFVSSHPEYFDDILNPVEIIR